MPEDDELPVAGGIAWEDDGRLPPELVAELERAKADGVSLSLDRYARDRIREIHWKRGDRNALADLIIEECRYPMELQLELSRFIILPYSWDNWKKVQE